MVGGLDRQDVELMPVPALFDRLASIRRVDARRRHDAFCEQLVAARGSEDGVRHVAGLLSQAGQIRTRRRGGVKDLQRLLGGGK